MGSNPITVLIDTREKYPLFFPTHIVCEKLKGGKVTKVLLPVKTKKQKLDYGDYALEGLENCCVVERKGSIREIDKNLYDYKDAIRTGKAFRRLVDNCSFPYLLLEFTPSTLIRSTTKQECHDGLAHRLSTVIARFNLRTLWVSKPTTPNSRRYLGAALLHIMVAHATEKNLITL